MLDMIIDLESSKISFEPHLKGEIRGLEHAGRIMVFAVPANTKRRKARAFVTSLLQEHDLRYSCSWDGSNWRGRIENIEAFERFLTTINLRTYQKGW